MNTRGCIDTSDPPTRVEWASGFPRMQRARNAALEALIALFDRLAEWQQFVRQCRELRQMTDRELKDIGLSRADVEREAAKSFLSRSSGETVWNR